MTDNSAEFAWPKESGSGLASSTESESKLGASKELESDEYSSSGRSVCPSRLQATVKIIGSIQQLKSWRVKRDDSNAAQFAAQVLNRENWLTSPH
jgi:hypothetical protein